MPCALCCSLCCCRETVSPLRPPPPLACLLLSPGMAYHRDPRADPLLQRGGGGGSDSEEGSSEEEGEAFMLREEDLLILAARNEDDVSHLEVCVCGGGVTCVWRGKGGVEVEVARRRGPACVPCRPPPTPTTRAPTPHPPLQQLWVYEEPDERGPANLFVHHTLLLPAFPLCLAWLDCDPLAQVRTLGTLCAPHGCMARGGAREGLWVVHLPCPPNHCCSRSPAPSSPHLPACPRARPPPAPQPVLLQRARGNFAAVGSFEPGIEIWDMDVLDAVEPIATLGGADYAAARTAAAGAAAAPGGSEQRKKKKKKKAKASVCLCVCVGGGVECGEGRGGWLRVRVFVAGAGAPTSTQHTHPLASLPCCTHHPTPPHKPHSHCEAGARGACEAWQPRRRRAGAGLESRVPQRVGLCLGWAPLARTSFLLFCSRVAAHASLLFCSERARPRAGSCCSPLTLPSPSRHARSNARMLTPPPALNPLPSPPPPADHTVKVWDVATQQCSHTLTHHTSKVQGVAWHPEEAPVLLTGGFDKRVCLVSRRGGGGGGGLRGRGCVRGVCVCVCKFCTPCVSVVPWGAAHRAIGRDCAPPLPPPPLLAPTPTPRTHPHPPLASLARRWMCGSPTRAWCPHGM